MKPFEVITEFNKGFAVAKLNNKYGFINKDLEVIVDFKYDKVNTFNEGFAIVCKFNRNNTITNNGEERILITDTYSFINSKGEELLSLGYDYIDDFIEGQAVVRLNKKYGIINQQGKQMTSCKYEDMWTCYTESEIYRIFLLEDKYGFITTEGTEILLKEVTDVVLKDKIIYSATHKNKTMYTVISEINGCNYIGFFGEEKDFNHWLNETKKK